MNIKNKPVIPQSQLVRDLAALGLQAGDTVMLHAAVSQIGWVVGGPEVVLAALLDVLTPAGTLMMLTSWEDNPYHLPEWPPEMQTAYREECPAYDPQRSRADRREMGILTEYLRTWPGAVRSRPPFSFTAVGARAAWITADHPWQYRDGAGSPLEKLCQVDGRVLLLGSPLANVTLLHYAEWLADVPDKRIDRYTMPVLIDGEKVWMEFEEFDTTNGIVDWPDDYFETIVRAYLEGGNGRSGKVGGADAHLFEAADLAAFGVAWMEAHFNPPSG